MIVVADTSPFNYLIQLGFSEILHELYGEVVIPGAVLSEMLHPEAPKIVKEWAESPPAWLRVISVRQLDRELPAKLGAGEREAISLAVELHASAVLMDEVAGRKEAIARDLTVTGTLTVLTQGALRGYWAFPEELVRLRKLGFWLSASTEAAVMSRYKGALNDSSH